MTQTIENHERLWSLAEASLVSHMSVYGMRKSLARRKVRCAVDGTTRNGGQRWRESDLKAVFGERFRPEKEADAPAFCPICGARETEGRGRRTFGLCVDCWCRELNVFLIGRRVKCGDAIAAMIASLKERGIIK